MITLTKEISFSKVCSAEQLKIKCLYDSYYKDDLVLFWTQDKDKAILSMADGNMTIFNHKADTSELSEFIKVLSPNSVFSDVKTLTEVGCTPKEEVFVLRRRGNIVDDTKPCELSSKEIYDLLNVKGLELPDYPYFAVDYCRRLNRGNLDTFAIRDKCVAVSIKSEDMALINGIASHEKGFGAIALKAIIAKNYGRDILVCCRENILEFYKKFGFEELYKAGYWEKK